MEIGNKTWNLRIKSYKFNETAQNHKKANNKMEIGNKT
jgi:hypothetical protein